MASPAHGSSDGRSSKMSTSRSRKIMSVTVNFLDDTSHVFQLQAKNLGQVLFDKVCKHITLMEVDYFGLEFEDEKNSKCWLDVLKPLCAQMNTLFPTMHFCVKFFTPDPVQLEDEFTRYFFALQIKKDILGGFLQCNDNTAAVLISYVVQADFGDYSAEKCSDSSYLSGYKFMPLQDEDMERKIVEHHKKLVGQTPAEADLNLLETARRCELYGIKMTAAKDAAGVPLNLAVAHLGVVVFQNYTKINTFSWAKIRKLSFKRKKFLIKLHPEGYGYYKGTVEFFFEGRNECKNFWKKCIENHTFFRCNDAKQGMRQKPKIFKRGSSFRYSGRTQKQVSDFVRENRFHRQPFQRSTSLRTPTSPSRSMAAMSPQPILPVTSMSCGSISDISKDTLPHPQRTQSASEPTTPHVGPDNGIGSKTSTGPGEPKDYIEEIIKRPDLDSPGNNNNNISTETRSSNQNGLTKETLTQHLNNLNIKSSSDRSDTSNNVSNITMTSHIKVEALIEHVSDLKNGSPSIDSFKRLSGESKSEEDHVSIDTSSMTDSYTKMSDSIEVKDGSMANGDSQSFGASTFYISSPYAISLSNKKKGLTDKAYCLGKELLMTERTYRKDLEIVNVVFRDEFSKQTDLKSRAVDNILSSIDPLYEIHCSMLRDLEQRLAYWEGKPANRNTTGIKGVGDILLLHNRLVNMHSAYMDKLPSILDSLFKDLSNNQRLSKMYQQFEAQKVCYLNLTTFLLRPVFRLMYYNSFLKDLFASYHNQHIDYDNCKDMLEILKAPYNNFESKIMSILNHVKLMELQRSLIGFSNLTDKSREFVREGCLYKFTKNGSHQHMFFLFSDVLLYTVRVHEGHLRFKVQGEIPTTSMKVEETQPRFGVSHCFTTCSSEKHMTMAAPSSKELTKWLTDLRKTAHSARSKKGSSSVNSSSHSLHESSVDRQDSSDEADDMAVLKDHRPVSNMNASIHICWHRNLSISRQDLLQAMKHSLSGYLLRKFKNSSGWQKVWVVLANLCLFFYRSYVDESPLASLPLAGYKILHTNNNDLVCGDCIFKLVFKNHEYFFMVENKNTFDRWMEAINMCTLMEEENTRL